MRMKSCVGLRKLYWYIYCIRKSTICRKGFFKIRVYHQECIKKISQVDCMTYVQDYISCTLKIDLFSQFVDYHQICHIILEQARFCGKNIMKAFTKEHYRCVRYYEMFVKGICNKKNTDINTRLAYDFRCLSRLLNCIL